MIRELGKAFTERSRAAQAVLGFATMACVMSRDGTASVADVRAVLGLSDEEWIAAAAELKDSGAMWLMIEDASRLQTDATHAMCMASIAPTNRPRAQDWAKLRERVFARDFGDDEEPSCAYCGAAGVSLELDHVLPISRGGSNHSLNLVPACKPCNCSKGAQTISEWRRSR